MPTEPTETCTSTAGDPESVDNLTAGQPGGTAIGVGTTATTGCARASRPQTRRRKTAAAARDTGHGEAVLEGLRWLCGTRSPTAHGHPPA